MKFNVRTLILCASTFVVVGALCVAALIVSGFVPAQTISDSIRSDYTWIEQRGDYPIFFSETPKYRYDGFSDGIMLMQAIPDDSLTAVENAVLAPYHAIGDGTPGGDGTGGVSPTQALLNLVSDPNTEQQRDYILYWHGYVVPLRALLTVLSPANIIALACVIFAVLSIFAFEAFRRIGGLCYGIAFIAALLATFAWIVPLGFKHFSVFFLAFAGIIALYFLLQKTKGREWILPLFLVLGLLTAFLDLLTTPLLTFLLPLSLYVLWMIKKQQESTWYKMVCAGAAWLVGYAGFWASKWLMTAIVYSSEYANTEFANAIALRSGAEGGGLSYRLAAIYNNLYQLLVAHPDGAISMNELFIRVAFGLVVLAAIWYLLVRVSNTSKEQIKQALPLLLIAVGPYVWYFVMANHSTFHSWFTWRLQAASILAIVFFILLSIDWSGLLSKEKPADAS